MERELDVTLMKSLRKAAQRELYQQLPSYMLPPPKFLATKAATRRRPISIANPAQTNMFTQKNKKGKKTNLYSLQITGALVQGIMPTSVTTNVKKDEGVTS